MNCVTDHIIKLFVASSLCICFTKVSAQNEASHDLFHKHHSLGLMISHTQIFQGVQLNREKKWLALPSLGLNYNYKFHPKWALGLHTDIVIEDFQVEEHLKSGGSNANSILERSYPVASALVASYKASKHFSLLIGAGGEFAPSGSLFMIRAGFEYGIHINPKWELTVNLVNDLKLNAYNSIAYGIGISKIL